MFEVSIALLAIAVLCALADWRWGLLLCIATAVLQDPFRKITPDQPVIFVVFVAMVFAGACLGALSRGVSLMPNRIFGRYWQVAAPMWFLVLLIIVQAFHSFVRFGNPMITLTGLLTYLLPLPSIVFAYQLVIRRGEARFNQFVKVYVLCIMLALTTVYLEYIGYDWPVLGQVGGTLWIYDRTLGALVTPYSGIFRASEIAAWHASTCACFVLLLATMRKVDLKSVFFAMMVVILLMGIVALTGRRKAIVQIVVFASTYFILWIVFQRKAATLGIALAVAGLVGVGWLVAQLGSDLPNSLDEKPIGYSVYVERSKTVFEDVPSRFVEMGIAPIMWAYDRFGLFGAGLGIGTQGTQHFSEGLTVSGAGEGGLGKITLELGILGLFVVAWLAIAVFIHLWRIMRAASRISPNLARLSYALFSFLVANGAAFSVATQAYADLFILLILSWTLGLLLAIPVLLEREVRGEQPGSFAGRTPILRPKAV